MIKLIFSLVLSAVTASSLLAQVTFQLNTNQSGLDHYYQSVNFMGGGCAFFDLNQDGWEDVWINGGSISDKCFMNNGDGTFRDVSDQIGLSDFNLVGSTAVITGDINNDGHREVFVCTGNNDSNKLYLNNGDGTFSDLSEASGIIQDTAWSTSASFGDINLDGYLDIYVGNYIKEAKFLYDDQNMTNGFDHDCFADFLYINNGDNTFTKVEDEYWDNQEGCVLASTFTDYDLDGDPDLMIANDFGEWVVPNRLFQNNFPTSSLSEISNSIGADPQLYGMGIAIGDYDLDQDLDYYITNLGRNVLLQNNDNSFTDVTADAKIEDTQYQNLNTVGWGTSFEDLNLDMYPDLIVVNGHIDALEMIATNPINPNRIFLNDKNGSFDDITASTGFFDGGVGRGLACSDVDNDGDIDLLSMNIIGLVIPGQETNIAFYKNNIVTDYNWIKFSLEGTKNNRDAYGSIVRCYVDGLELMRELNGGSSHASQNSSVIHFGLETNETIDSVTVTWPGGKVQTLLNLEVNSKHHIVEDLGLYSSVNNFDVKSIRIYPSPAFDILNIDCDQAVDVFRLFDSMGRIVLQGSGKQIDISTMDKGVYFIELRIAKEKKFIRQFVKM